MTALHHHAPPGNPAPVAAGLEAALRARAPRVHASTAEVADLAVRAARRLGLGEEEQALVDVCARVRDVGMLALPDAVLLSTAQLSPEEWELVTRHPVTGAEILAGLPELERAAAIVRAHHERWDGEGYPDGLRGEQIPLLARVIAACDAFVAVEGDRPHRRGSGFDAALEHLEQESGSQLDPAVVSAVRRVVCSGRVADGPGPVVAARSVPGGGGRADLRSALGGVDVVPAFSPAVERLLRADVDAPDPVSRAELVATIESDVGLTIAVLRAGQAATRGPVSTVAAALAALGADALRAVAAELPRARFPWQSWREALLHRLRVHAHAVARASERIAREAGLVQIDDLLTGALLHDVGKLVLGAMDPGLVSRQEIREVAPERRVQRERREAGFDHASIGGLLIRRWGLRSQLAGMVSSHHTSEDGQDPATLLRLADMVAHHAQGDAVDRRIMLRVAQAVGLPVKALRDILFDLPHASGSRRRRAEPSPLSSRETTILRWIAEGRPMDEIAGTLGVSPSTVRSHLHRSYEKMGVRERAQAVLLATEMGWL